ncbi:DUF485 domain-containing protein [Streptomyces sp. H51]|uniref:DUF485 domain-containing protein n=1 Tax=Streptomyces sp. H51 TaxID=3111770 RepID=UPI002D7910EA|nr:DUF485 domain-containing protein [Streptomyces sp. H51]
MQSSNGPTRAGGDIAGSPAAHDDDHAPPAAAAPAGVRYDDPWYDALPSGWGESAGGGVPVPARAAGAPGRTGVAGAPEAAAQADVYLQVQRGAAFQEVRRRYRRFVVPGVVVFLAWYVGYVVTATTAPALMARPVAGSVNVGMAAGLGQFLSTFLLAWAYARHARLRRDRPALELRWDTQELTRGARGGAR